MIARRLIGVSGCAFVMSLAASSFADGAARRVEMSCVTKNPFGEKNYGRDVPISIMLGQNNNNITKDATPGIEHVTTTVVNNNGVQTLVVVAIRGKDTDEKQRGDYRSTCSSYEITKTGLTAIATGVSLKEKLDGNKARTFNRPILQATNHAGNDNYAVIFYVSENDSEKPSAWARAINSKCETISEPMRLSHNISYADTEQGAKDLDGGTPPAPRFAEGNHDPMYVGDYNEGIGGNTAFMGTAADGADVFQYGITRGHNDENVGYVRNLRISSAPGGQKTLAAAGWEWTMYGNLTRQFVMPIAETANSFASQTLSCGNAASNRNNNERPGRAGVKCYSVKTTENGNKVEVVSSFAVAPKYTDKGMEFYPNQASGSLVKVDAAAGFAYFAVTSVDSNGAGKNTNTQGTNTARATLAKVALFSHDSTGTISTISSVTGTSITKHAKHAFGVTTPSYGPNGQPAMAIFSASPTGVTPGALRVLPIKADMTGFDAWDQKEWVTGLSDSGYLSNKLGDNPGDQGRDFPRVYATVTNPGYGLADGFMNMAKTLWVVSYAGQDKQSNKNHGFIGLVPASWDSSVDPHPINATSADLPTNDPAPEAPPVVAPAPAADSGCACSTPGATSTGGSMLGGLALFGLVLGGMIRRRKA